VVYAFSGRRQGSTAKAPDVEVEPLRDSTVVPRFGLPGPALAAFDAAADSIGNDVFRFADGETEMEEPTVQPDLKVPALASADDAEPPGPDDLGSFWLSRATQSERSLTELDLQPDVEAIADLRAEPERETEDEDEAQDRALAEAERAI
jgi:hypothetical protein